MKKQLSSRRDFIRLISIPGLTLAIAPAAFSFREKSFVPIGKRVGIIGLDTSHVIEFTKILNNKDATEFHGYKVTCAFPLGSPGVMRNTANIARYTEEIKQYGVRIVSSIDELLSEVDAVLLETNDGNLHLNQAIPVFKTGKPVFIDKPLAASLAYVIAIYEEAEKFHSPVFSSSAMRYSESALEVAAGGIGKVIGADVYSPDEVEKSHTALFWYGIHGVETLFTIMGTGCESVTCLHSNDTDVVVGKWNDGRLGTYRAIRSGKEGFGGSAFGEKDIANLGKYSGYHNLVSQIALFFESGKPPIIPSTTIEIYAFMEAAAESTRIGGLPVTLNSVMKKAKGIIKKRKLTRD